MSNFTAPLRFQPIVQPRIWGGRKLAERFGKVLPDDGDYGESWEICDRPEAVSTLIGGGDGALNLHDLWTNHRSEVFGPGSLACDWPHFPVLIKILDAREALSLQVHPPPHVIPELGGECKTEWWYVVDALPDAKIFAGLKKGIQRADFEKHLHEGTLESCVHQLHPTGGSHLFLPSGRFHAIGAGLLIFEVQQNSDTTYRVYDWNRVDADGNARDLHIEQSLQSIDFADFEPELDHADQPAGESGGLVSCDWFSVKKSSLSAGESHDHSDKEGVILAVLDGNLTWGTESAGPGEFLLLPASLRPENAPKAGGSGAHYLEITPGYRPLD